MKNTKKILSLVLSLAIAGAVAMPAFAAETTTGSGSITFKDATTEVKPPNPPTDPDQPPTFDDKDFNDFASNNILNFGEASKLAVDKTYPALGSVDKHETILGLLVDNGPGKNFELKLTVADFTLAGSSIALDDDALKTVALELKSGKVHKSDYLVKPVTGKTPVVEVNSFEGSKALVVGAKDAQKNLVPSTLFKGDTNVLSMGAKWSPSLIVPAGQGYNGKISTVLTWTTAIIA